MSGSLTEAVLFELLSLDCRVDSDGYVRYYNALGHAHREYGPAVERPNGRREWWQNGQRHRIDGPAIEYTNGGASEWWQNGLLHRIGGPAVEYLSSRREWWQNGQLHRLDGPAIEQPDTWYINGKVLTEAEWQQVVASMGNV